MQNNYLRSEALDHHNNSRNPISHGYAIYQRNLDFLLYPALQTINYPATYPCKNHPIVGNDKFGLLDTLHIKTKPDSITALQQIRETKLKGNF